MTDMEALMMLLRVVVLFLIVLFALLCVNFPRLEFFRWWTAAWMVFGLHLEFDVIGRALNAPIFFLAQLLMGYIQSPLLIIGARRYDNPARASRTKPISLGLISAVAMGLLFYWLSLMKTGVDVPLIQNLPRKLFLTAALGYCVLVCLRRWTIKCSWSALATAFAFAISGVNELGSSIDWFYSIHRISFPELILRMAHFLGEHQFGLGLTWPFMVSLGMILLLLEEHRRVELAEAESSKAREELERNFAKAVRSSLDAITISDLDSGRYLEANGTFLQLTGYERNEVIGHTSIELGFLDSQQRTAFVGALREAGSLQNFEIDIRKRDGSTATLISSAELLVLQGKPHALSMAKDITDRKRAQQEIQALNERLISAHEEERMRIARELHDDFSQQIAALSISASNLKRCLSGERVDQLEQVESLRLKLRQLAESVRHLSHQLHPAMLEYAGLAAALRSYCAEFRSLSGVNVSFHASEAFDHLSPSLALCIYRVTQEALQNVAKHALAKDADVSLIASNGLVSLTVSDRGAGCSLNRIGAPGGLGLISMQERAKLVNGTFEFSSEPNRGTTVRVRIPMTGGAHK